VYLYLVGAAGHHDIVSSSPEVPGKRHEWRHVRRAREVNPNPNPYRLPHSIAAEASPENHKGIGRLVQCMLS
jgi:hypothetical protein